MKSQKCKDLHSVRSAQCKLNEFVKSHFSVRDYFVVIGKYCQKYDSNTGACVKATECGGCKSVKMTGGVWADLSTRKPLLPDPEPMAGEWLQYEDLVNLRLTSGKYQPSLDKSKLSSNGQVLDQVLKATKWEVFHTMS